MGLVKFMNIFLVPELGQGHLCHHFPFLDQEVLVDMEGCSQRFSHNSIVD